MKILIFGTHYVDRSEKLVLTEQWLALHGALNPSCDLLLVDANFSACSLYEKHPGKFIYHTDNIGHLARRGQDGWGRAFCGGLEHAIDREYDYVVHVEGDSLFRRPVASLCEFMHKQGLKSFVCGVNGTRLKEFAWIETGIMFMSVPYVRDSNFIERYDWRDGKSKKYPHTPEAVICHMLDEDCALNIAPIKTMRDDKGVLTPSNVGEYDWISHTTPEIYATFVTNSMVPA